MQNKLQKIVIFLTMVCLAQLSMASKKKDVVKISLPNKTAIEIVGTDINKYKVDTAFITENIGRFFKFYETSNVEEMLKAGPKSISINVTEGKLSHYTHEAEEDAFYEFSIKENEVPNQIVSSNNFDKNLFYLQKHQLEFENYNFSFTIKFDNVDQLKDFNHVELLGALDAILLENYNEKSKHIQKLHYTIGRDFIFDKVYENTKESNDQIIISGITGIENVKNTWAANFEATMAFAFSRKGIMKNSYSLYYEWQYDFSNTDNRNINQFMGLGYCHDFSNDPDDSNAYTIKLGYLANKQGNLYKDDTFKLGLRRSLGKNIYMEPQIYFNDFFKDVIPSIKIGIGL